MPQMDQIREDIKELREDIRDLRENIKKDIDSNEEASLDYSKNLSNKIDTVRITADEKFNSIYESIRGNGKIGLSEDNRKTKTQIKVIFVVILFLFGADFFGISMKSISNLFREKPNNTTQVEVDDVEKPKVIIEE